MQAETLSLGEDTADGHPSHPTLKRALVLIGGIMLMTTQGAVNAWSVFRDPLMKEFG
jgi:hypothetical protein